MAFKNESASKHGHSNITSNPDVKKFLERCPDVEVPTKKDLEEHIKKFYKVDDFHAELPKLLLAIDCSFYESFVDEEYPSRQVGYIKISSVLLNMEKYLDIGNTQSKYINPREIARLQKEIDTISLALPGAYVRLPECDTVTETFRKTLLDYLKGETTRLNGKTLFDTLVVLIEYLGRIKTDQEGVKHIIFSKCAVNNCQEQAKAKGFKIYLDIDSGIGICPICNCNNYASDVLRIFEEFSETDSNVQADSRIMSFLEHLLAVHYIYYLWKNDFNLLSKMCVFLDGPLAIFGPSAVFRKAIMLLINDVREYAKKLGFEEPLIMGLSKTGRVYEHFLAADRISKDFIQKGTFFMISDEYRYRFIDSAQKDHKKNHGEGTYYGQDIFIKTKKGGKFVVSLAYPFKDKGEGFQTRKLEVDKYTKLAHAITVIQELEADLYDNSVVPLVLAHKHTSISLKPGGKVLDILTTEAFKKTK